MTTKLSSAVPPEPVDYVALAQSLTAMLNEVRAKVPFLTDPRPNQDLRKLNSAAGVPDAFVERLGGIAMNSPLVASVLPADAATAMRELRRFAAAFAGFEHQVKAFAASVTATLILARHESGSTALSAYVTAKTLLRQPGGLDLKPHVRELYDLLGRGPRRHLKKTPEPPVPETAAATAVNDSDIKA